MDNSNTQGLSVGQAILIFVGFFLALFIASLIKKIYYSVRYKKRFYIIPKVSVKGIANIAMVISISIAVIILLTVISADLLNVVFRAWPGTRVTLEGILIKIGGLLFGPFIGMFIGAMTDLLAVALTAGVFHYGYLIAAMAYGLIGGLIRVIFSFSKKKEIQFAFYSTVLTIIIGICVSLFLFYGVKVDVFRLSFLGVKIVLTKTVLVTIIAAFFPLLIATIWISLFIYLYQKKRNPQKSINWFNTFAPVLVAIILSEAIVDVIMMPSFDAQLSSLNYEQWISIRTILFIPMVVLNVVVIYPIFKIVVPMINYDYSKEQVEDKRIPVYHD